MDRSIQGILHAHTSQMDQAINKVINAVLHLSRLDVSRVRISDITEDTFNVTLAARATNTGPLPAQVSSMVLDLHGPAGCFGQVESAPLNVRPLGTRIEVHSQLVHITNKPALLAFVASVMSKPTVTLALKNGHCTVKALSLDPREAIFDKTMKMNAINGSAVRVDKATVEGDAVDLTLAINNPSPVEIEYGECTMEIQNAQGEVCAEVVGQLDIRNGNFKANFKGFLHRSVPFRQPTRLVGKSRAGAAWCEEAIRGINVEMQGASKIAAALEMDKIQRISSDVGEVAITDVFREKTNTAIKELRRNSLLNFWKK